MVTIHIGNAYNAAWRLTLSFYSFYWTSNSIFRTRSFNILWKLNLCNVKLILSNEIDANDSALYEWWYTKLHGIKKFNRQKLETSLSQLVLVTTSLQGVWNYVCNNQEIIFTIQAHKRTIIYVFRYRNNTHM